MHNSNDIPRVDHEAFHTDNGIPGDDGISHSSDEDKSHDTHVATHTSNIRSCCHHDGVSEVDHDAGNIGDNIPKNAVRAAADVGHGDDVVHQSHEHDGTHSIEGLTSLADNSIHGNGDDDVHKKHDHNGTHEVRHVALNICGCHDNCVGEDDIAGNSIHPVCHAIHAYDNISGHEQPAHRPYHKDAIEAHGTHEIRQDAATALSCHGCHNDGMSEVHADNCDHGDDSAGCADDNACKIHEHNDTGEVRHVVSPALDISGCHHNGMSEVNHEAIEAGGHIRRVCLHAVHAHDNIYSHDPPTHASSVCFQHHHDDIKTHNHPTHFSDCSPSQDEDVASDEPLQCQHGRKVVDLPNNVSSLHSQHTDLDSSTHQGHEDQTSQGAAIFCCKKCLGKVSKNPVRNLVQLPCFDWRDIVENWFGACCCSFGSKAEILSASFEKSLQLIPGKCLVGPATFYVDFSDVTVETESMVLNTDSKNKQSTTSHFLALGNGFMVWENQQSKYFSWLPVYCTGCASLIGAYACKPADSGLIREGLHLFRCQIMAFNADGTLYDTCRYAAYKELLAKELRLRTEENTSYRFLIRSLSSQLPLLQLVVLSYDSLICTGKVTAHMLDLGEHPESTSETTSLVGEVGLQQSMKVLFLDCSGFSANEIRSTECWGQDYDAETIFMLEEFVDILKRELMSNRMFYPAACGLSQVFHGSFIHMSQEGRGAESM